MKRSIAILSVVLLFACSEEFNPVAEGERPFVVFALMNTSGSTQIARVHETSPPGGGVPGNPPLAGATVLLLGPEGVQTFRDTLLVPQPGSPDTAAVGAYVIDPFTPIRGLTYTLNVTSSRGDATATMTIPGPGDMTTNDFLVLQRPYAYAPTRSITVQALLSPLALGYVIRFVIEYERLVGGVWTTEYLEVPRVYLELIDEKTFTAEYPNLTRRVSEIVTSSRGVRTREGATFRNSEYLKTLSILYSRYGQASLRMKRALIILTQADHNFYMYYSRVNLEEDKLTIRVDQPDYSNMDGALGFFGAITTDTLAYLLPPDLSP